MLMSKHGRSMSNWLSQSKNQEAPHIYFLQCMFLGSVSLSSDPPFRFSLFTGSEVISYFHKYWSHESEIILLRDDLVEIIITVETGWSFYWTCFSFQILETQFVFSLNTKFALVQQNWRVWPELQPFFGFLYRTWKI